VAAAAAAAAADDDDDVVAIGTQVHDSSSEWGRHGRQGRRQEEDEEREESRPWQPQARTWDGELSWMFTVRSTYDIRITRDSYDTISACTAF